MIILEQELHANTRRTRITYRATVDGKAVALKCYRKPALGLFHWVRAGSKGRKLRRADTNFPDIVYSGWVPQARCFAYGTAFLEGYRPLREVLATADNNQRRSELICKLGHTLADLHAHGIEQTDGNLTNFLVGPDDTLVVIDEDDIRLHKNGLSSRQAAVNLANVACRFGEQPHQQLLVSTYLARRESIGQPAWDEAWFHHKLSQWSEQLASRRRGRNLETYRRFD